MHILHPKSTEQDPFLSLLAAARQGDAAAQDRLFRRFYPRVERMVHARLARDLRTRRPWLAARFSTGDVVQEVFRSVLADLRAFAGTNEDAFAGYLAMVVRNRIIDAVRFHEASARDGRRSREALDAVTAPPESSDAAEEVAAGEELARFHAVLAEFPEREQLLLRARLGRAESFPELAQQLGYSSPTAARRAFHAAEARLALRLGRGA